MKNVTYFFLHVILTLFLILIMLLTIVLLLTRLDNCPYNALFQYNIYFVLHIMCYALMKFKLRHKPSRWRAVLSIFLLPWRVWRVLLASPTCPVRSTEIKFKIHISGRVSCRCVSSDQTAITKVSTQRRIAKLWFVVDFLIQQIWSYIGTKMSRWNYSMFHASLEGHLAVCGISVHNFWPCLSVSIIHGTNLPSQN